MNQIFSLYHGSPFAYRDILNEIVNSIYSEYIKTNKAEIGEELTIRYSDKWDTSALYFVYVDDFRVDTLEPLFPELDYYKFSEVNHAPNRTRNFNHNRKGAGAD